MDKPKMKRNPTTKAVLGSVFGLALIVAAAVTV
jgi:hypothetical protein